MALKTKQPRFKEISGKMDTGGAPIFNDDLIMLQQNSDSDFINSMEYYRRKLPTLYYYINPGNPSVKKHENGLILSGLTYDNTNPLLPVISEGYFLSGGEVCYYGGGTIVPLDPNPCLVSLKKGAPLFTSRIFSDSINKEITVSYGVVVEISQIAGPGVIFPTGSTTVITDEVVVIECGAVSTRRIAESYFTKEAALGVNTLGNRLSTSTFAQATTTVTSNPFTSFVTNRGTFLVSRVDNEGFTHIHGAVKFTGSTANELDIQLTSHSFTHSPSDPIGIPCMVNIDANTLYFPAMASVFSSGVIRFKANFNGLATNNFVLDAVYYFDCKIMGAIPTAYTYYNTFLDIT